MNDIEKLRALLPHWIEHNQEHAAEFENWAAKASGTGQNKAAEIIRRAAQEMQVANDTLQSALNELGGPVHVGHHSHTH